MGWISGPVVYLLIWWLSLFLVLPWGGAPVENPLLGNAPSAPANPRLRLKFIVTTVLAAILWLGVYAVMRMDIVSFGAIADQMVQQDNMK